MLNVCFIFLPFSVLVFENEYVRKQLCTGKIITLQILDGPRTHRIVRINAGSVVFL